MSGRESPTSNDATIAGDLVEEEAGPISDIPVILHVGLHKTATTWLQTQMFSKNDSIVYCGDNRLSHAAFLTPRFGDFSVGRVHRLFAPHIEKARATGLPIVISDEALGGLPFHQRHLAEHTAVRLHQAFPRAILLVTIREQARIIGSIYGEYLRYGYASGLSAFLDQETGNPNIHPVLDLEYYSFARKWRFYADLFGSDRVAMIPMEWLLEDPGRFVAHLSGILGQRVDLPDTARPARRVRPALSGPAQAILRLANHCVPQDSRWRVSGSRLSPNSIAYHVDRLTPGWARHMGKGGRTAFVRKAVGSYYGSSNKAVSDIIGLDLSRYEYVVKEPSKDGANATQDPNV
ncbi:MAG: hypothetical protein AAF829_06795 [Pseudomonadota bacterium]